MKRLVLVWLSLWLITGATASTPTQIKATVTAYCPCAACCAKWALESNRRREKLKPGVSVAGPRRYPLGTRVWIEGLGERVIQDRPALRYDNRFDVFFTNHVQATLFGKRQLEVRIIPTVLVAKSQHSAK